MNSTAVFECPQLVADLEPYITWLYINSSLDFEDDEKLSGYKKVSHLLSGIGDGWWCWKFLKIHEYIMEYMENFKNTWRNEI